MRERLGRVVFCVQMTGLLLVATQTASGFGDNGWETDHVYACQRKADGGALRVYTESGTYVGNLAGPGTNWWSLTFAGKGNDDARLFVMKPDPYWSDDAVVPTDLIVAELGTDGAVLPGQETTVASLLGLGAGHLGGEIEPKNIRFNPHGASGAGSLLIGVNDTKVVSPIRIYEINLDLSTILNVYTGPSIRGGHVSIAVDWDHPRIYVTSQNLGGTTNKGDVIAFDLSGGFTSSYTTLIDGSNYAATSDWYEPEAIVWRGGSNPEGRPTIIITFRNIDNAGNDEYLCPPREHYLDATDGPPSDNLALRRRYTGDMDNGTMVNGQKDHLAGDVWWGSLYLQGVLHTLRPDDSASRYNVGRHYDAASPGAIGTAAIPPSINEVIPDPKMVVCAEYTEQLNLSAGSLPITWILLQGPAGAQVDSTGWVHGWAPAAGDFGLPVAFTVQASNTAGSDVESWNVVVFSRTDFDQDNDVDQEDFGLLQRCLSGPNQTASLGCVMADLDKDGDVDLDDFNAFQSCVAGPNTPPGC